VAIRQRCALSVAGYPATYVFLPSILQSRFTGILDRSYGDKHSKAAASKWGKEAPVSFIELKVDAVHYKLHWGITMEMESLKDLMIDELKDLYSAENQILKALPKMIKKATSPDLKRGFEKHLKETEGHVERLDKIFQELEESPRGKKCKGMEGIIEDGKELMEEDAELEVMDAGLIAAAQHVEHYEMAGYGCVRTYAELLGMNNIAKLLQKTLDEETATDEKLTDLARNINVEAEKAA
jgi:ferritin-like metal-binding protein YciE